MTRIKNILHLLREITSNSDTNRAATRVHMSLDKLIFNLGHDKRFILDLSNTVIFQVKKRLYLGHGLVDKV